MHAYLKDLVQGMEFPRFLILGMALGVYFGAIAAVVAYFLGATK